MKEASSFPCPECRANGFDVEFDTERGLSVHRLTHAGDKVNKGMLKYIDRKIAKCSKQEFSEILDVIFKEMRARLVCGSMDVIEDGRVFSQIFNMNESGLELVDEFVDRMSLDSRRRFVEIVIKEFLKSAEKRVVY